MTHATKMQARKIHERGNYDLSPNSTCCVTSRHNSISSSCILV